MLGRRAGAEAARARGLRGVGGTGCVWFGPVVTGGLDRALVSGDRRGRVRAVVGLVTLPGLSLSSRGQNKDKPHQQQS